MATATWKIKPTGRIYTLYDQEDCPIAVKSTIKDCHIKAEELASQKLLDERFNYWYDRVIIENVVY